MGSKRNPGKFDCYEAAMMDEPMFILLARDRHAPELVMRWAQLREQAGEDKDKIQEAVDCANAMIQWRRENRSWENQP